MSDDRRQTSDPSASLRAGDRRLTTDSPASPFGVALGSLGASGHRLVLASHSAAVVGGRWSVVELEIGELVLRGFEHTDRYRVGAAVERELALLLAEQSLLTRLGHSADLARLDGGSIELPAGASAETLGVRIAQAIYRCCIGEVDQ